MVGEWYGDDDDLYFGEDEPQGYIKESEVPDLMYCEELMRKLVVAVYESGDVEMIQDCLVELLSEFQDIGYCQKIKVGFIPLIERKDKILNGFADIVRSHYEDLKKEKEQIAEEA